MTDKIKELADNFSQEELEEAIRVRYENELKSGRPVKKEHFHLNESLEMCEKYFDWLSMNRKDKSKNFYNWDERDFEYYISINLIKDVYGKDAVEWVRER